MPFVFYHSLPYIFEIKSFIQPGTSQYGKTSFQVSLRDAFFSHPCEGNTKCDCHACSREVLHPPSFFLLKFYLGMQGTQHTWQPKNNFVESVLSFMCPGSHTQVVYRASAFPH